MNTIQLTNHRITTRNELNIHGKASLRNTLPDCSCDIVINNISLKGIQILFSDNDFLYKIMETHEKKSNEIFIEFISENQLFSFTAEIQWLRIYDIGEKNFYSLTGLIFNSNEYDLYKDSLISLLVDINMNKFYLSKLQKVEESLIG